MADGMRKRRNRYSGSALRHAARNVIEDLESRLLLSGPFGLNDRVTMLQGGVTVRSSAAGGSLGTQTLSQQGAVIGGPVVASLSGTSYTWYNVNWDSGVDGWSADLYIGPVAAVAPSISNVSPTSMPASNGDQTLTVNGSNFANGATLTFDPPTGVNLNSNSSKLTFNSSGQITYQINNGNDVGTWAVRVNNPNGQQSGWANFTVAPVVQPPAISNVSPTSMPASNSDQTLTINGSNFVNGATLTFDPPTGSDLNSNASKLSFNSSGQITYQINNGGDAGTWAVRVNNPNGQQSGWANFTVTAVAAAPSINNVSPSSVPASNSQQALTINGSNFNTSTGTTLEFDPPTGANINTTDPSRFTTRTSSQIVYQFNNQSDAGTWQVRVRNADGQYSGWASFQVTAVVAAPSISNVSPTSMPASNGDQTLTINGSNFVSGATLTFDPPTGSNINSNAAKLTFNSSGQITYQVNNGSDVGTWAVRVNNPDGQQSGWANFAVTAVVPAPSISQVLPTSVPASTNQQPLTINGSNFNTGVGTTLTFDPPTGANITTSDPSRFTTRTGSQIVYQFNNDGDVGTWQVRVNNADGQQSGWASFEVAAVAATTTYAIAPSPATVNENAGTLPFTITRSGALPAETVYASTLNGAGNGYATNSGDYGTNVNNLAVVFAAGQTQATVTVTILNDAIAESSETFGLIVQRDPGDSPTTYLATTAFTIVDNDGATGGTTDYPGATWVDGVPGGNYTAASRNSADIRWIIIHTTEGTADSAIQWFKNSASAVSAHYLVKRDGSVVQLVRDANIAHHAGNFPYNQRSIGIEHERYAGSDVTPAQYQASANLVQWLADRYAANVAFPGGIAPADPASGLGVIGHDQVPDPGNATVGGGISHHTDPVNWNWTYYQGLFGGTNTAMPVPLGPGATTSPGTVLGTSATTTFSWSPATGATEYGVYLSKLQPNGTYTLVFDSTDAARQITIPGTSSTYTLPAGILEDGGHYRWNMNAKVNGVWGTYTGRLYFKVSTAPLPSTPTGLSVAAAGPTTLTIDWPDVDGATVYHLYRATGAAGPFQQVYVGPHSQYADGPTTLAPGTAYFYRVAAGNSSGDSAQSASASATTSVVNKPSTPTGVQAVTAGGSAIDVSWVDVISAGFYVVERSSSVTGTFTPVARLAESVTSYHDAALPTSTVQATFYYRVRSLASQVLSDPSVVASATVISTTQRTTPASGTQTAVNGNPYSGVARLYKLNWEAAKTTTAQARKSLWTPVTSLSDIDWGNVGKKTIMLTHGWNDRLDVSPNDAAGYDQDFMNIFATEFVRGREGAENGYNVLAVDWFDNGSRNGSDPNHAENPSFSAPIDVASGGQLDAQRSMANGVNAAEALGTQLASAGIDPQRLMLIGHSNGAGFMGRLAKVLYANAGRRKVAELNALDAPYLTSAQFEVSTSASAVTQINNYYLPVVQIQDTGVQLLNKVFGDVATSPVGGMGGPIYHVDNVTNFELKTSLPTFDLFFHSMSVIGHTQVPVKFAHAASGYGTGLQPWGLETSPFITGGSNVFSGSFWSQDISGNFSKAFFQPLLNELANAGLVIGGAAFTGGALAGTVIANVSQKTLDVVGGAGAYVGTGINHVYHKAVSAGGTALSWIEAKVQSILPAPVPGLAAAPGAYSVYASIPVTIPANVSLVGFDLSVINPGNSDKLQVAIGGQMIGELDLTTAFSTGTDSVAFWVGDHAGETTTLNFLVPSTTATATEFTIGNLLFGEVESGIPGDANRDGTVDFNDLVPLAQNYNDLSGTKTWADGDFTGDGNVDFNDLVKLAQNYNTAITTAPTPPDVKASVGQSPIADGQSAPINFGTKSQSAAGPLMTFQITNAGGSALVLGVPTLPAGFTLVDGLSATLSPGQSDTFSVRLSSSAPGLKGGEIRFTTNDPDTAVFNFAVTGVVTAAAIPSVYSLTDLGDFAGGEDYSAAYGINGLGQVVGTSGGAGGRRAFMWTPGTGLRDLGTLGGSSSTAWDVNDSGTVVGMAARAGDGVLRAFRWNGTTMTDLGAAGGESSAEGINAAGQVVGWWRDGSNRTYAFYDDGAMHDLGGLGGFYTGLYDVNGAGLGVGNGRDPSNRERVFTTTATGPLTDLGIYPGMQHSGGYGINDAGQIAGDGGGTGFLLEGGVFTDIGHIGNGSTLAWDVNNAGWVTGSSGGAAYLWTAATGIRNLNAMLNASGAGWTLTEARAINDGGQIVGIGTRDGVTRAFLLTPEYLPKATVTLGQTVVTDGQAAPVEFGSVTQGTQGPVMTFTVTNAGGDTLVLGTPTVPAGFVLTEGLAASLAPGASDTFSVQMATSSFGPLGGDVSFTTNDPAAAPFNFAVRGSVTAPAGPPPEIRVTGSNGQNIDDGDVGTSELYGTYFGSPAQGRPAVSRTFRVSNDGAGALAVGPVTLPAGFSLTEPLSGSIAPGSYDDFTVTLSTAAVGTFGGDVSFLTNDGDEGAFNFRITGSVTPQVSEVRVTGGDNQNIDDGDVGTSVGYGTEFGAAGRGGIAISRTYRVSNDGTGPLVLGAVSLPPGFALTEPLSSSIAPGAYDDFTVTLSTAAVGAFGGDVAFATNDPDEGSFNFRITGTVVAAPVIAVVSPDPVNAVPGVAQTFTLNGGNFAAGAIVRLKDLTNGGTFDHTPVAMNGNQINLTVTFPAATASWSAQVINPGESSSNVVGFTVNATGSAISSLAAGLSSPGSLQVVGGEVYFVDNTATDGVLKKVAAAGGPVTTLITGAAIWDSGTLRGIGRYAIDGEYIYGDYGGYSSLNIFRAPKAGGAATTLISPGGGGFVGIANSTLYYAQSFFRLNSKSLVDGTESQVLTGNFIRSVAVDAGAIYWIEYDSKSLRRFNVQTSALTTLATFGSEGGALALDAANVYLTVAGNLIKVAKAGGAPTTLLSTGDAISYAVDGGFLYYTAGGKISRMSVNGGAATTLVDAAGPAVTSVVVSGGVLYWTDNSGGAGAGKIYRMTLPAAGAVAAAPTGNALAYAAPPSGLPTQGRGALPSPFAAQSAPRVRPTPAKAKPAAVPARPKALVERKTQATPASRPATPRPISARPSEATGVFGIKPIKRPDGVAELLL